MIKWIKANLLGWILDGIKLILVAYFSYYLLKIFANIELVSEMWGYHERYYLASYATIQVLVTFIFYTGFGKLFELLIYRWIRKNQEELILKLDKNDEKVVKKFLNWIVRLLKLINVFDLEDLEILEGIELDKNEFRQKWKKTVEILKSVTGILVLALINLFVFYDSTVLFVWLTVAFIVLAIGSFAVLVVYYFLIENLHLVNLSLRSIAVSGRLLRRKVISSQNEEEP